MSLKMNLTMNVEGYEVAQDSQKWHYRVVYFDDKFMFGTVGTAGTDIEMDKYSFVGEWFFADYDEAEDVADKMNQVGKDYFL